MRFKSITLLMAATFASIACGPSVIPEPGPDPGTKPDPETDKKIAVTSVSLSQTSVSLEVGEAFILKATVLPSNATDTIVIWESDDYSIASVSQGTVTAIAEGSARITAKAGEKSAVCKVTVTARTSPPVDTTVIDPPVDTTVIDPPVDTTVIDPPVDTTVIDPPVDTTVIDPPVDTTVIDPPVDTTVIDPPVDTTVIDPEPVKLSFTQASYHTYPGDEFTPEVLANGEPYAGSLMWSITDESLATVDSQGKVKVLKSSPVTARIKAAVSDEQFAEAEIVSIVRLSSSDGKYEFTPQGSSANAFSAEAGSGSVNFTLEYKGAEGWQGYPLGINVSQSGEEAFSIIAEGNSFSLTPLASGEGRVIVTFASESIEFVVTVSSVINQDGGTQYPEDDYGKFE